MSLSLPQPDVQVTNASDKEQQLPKILELNETVKAALGAHDKREAALKQLARAMAAKGDEQSLTAALAAAEQADVATANLERGREALAAIQAAKGERAKVLAAFTEAQRVASEAFDRAQQLAKASGLDVKVDSSGSTLSVTVRSLSDGKSDSVELDKVWVQHLVGSNSGNEPRAAADDGGGCCLVQ